MPQRGIGLQPKVGAQRLPWVPFGKGNNANGVMANRRRVTLCRNRVAVGDGCFVDRWPGVAVSRQPL